jgi:hypothetical protein
VSKYLDHLRKCQANKKMVHATPAVSKMVDAIEVLERILWERYRQDACRWGASIAQACEIANKQINEIHDKGKLEVKSGKS